VLLCKYPLIFKLRRRNKMKKRRKKRILITPSRKILKKLRNRM
jgi:hypothetical protein